MRGFRQLTRGFRGASRHFRQPTRAYRQAMRGVCHRCRRVPVRVFHRLCPRPLRLAFRRLDPANLRIDGADFFSQGAVLLGGNSLILRFGVKIWRQTSGTSKNTRPRSLLGNRRKPARILGRFGHSGLTGFTAILYLLSPADDAVG